MNYFSIILHSQTSAVASNATAETQIHFL